MCKCNNKFYPGKPTNILDGNDKEIFWGDSYRLDNEPYIWTFSPTSCMPSMSGLMYPDKTKLKRMEKVNVN